MYKIVFGKLLHQNCHDGVKYVEVKINDTIDGAIVFPAKTSHEINYLEVISENKLREELNLNDGDLISLEF